MSRLGQLSPVTAYYVSVRWALDSQSYLKGARGSFVVVLTAVFVSSFRSVSVVNSSRSYIPVSRCLRLISFVAQQCSDFVLHCRFPFMRILLSSILSLIVDMLLLVDRIRCILGFSVLDFGEEMQVCL